MIPVSAGGGFGNDVAAEIRALRQQIEELKGQLAWQQRDTDYRLDTLGMKRSWQESVEGNLRYNAPRTIDLYIPPETKEIARVLLRLRLLEYETYTSIMDIVGESRGETDYAVWEEDYDMTKFETENAGMHNHWTANIEYDGEHKHEFYLRNHRHWLTVPNHTHFPGPALLRFGRAEQITLAINGVDVTEELGGPFNKDQSNLDITKYIKPIGWNTLTFSTLKTHYDEGRIKATVFVEIYLP